MRGVSLLVDLDGTLTEPAPGIIGSVRYALEQVGVEAPAGDNLHWVIGPPLRDMFVKLGVPQQDVERAVALYRDRYVGNLMYDATVHAGMHEALASLRAMGARLYVATSKPHSYARQILAHFEFAELFDDIYGAELDGARSNKAELIAYILSERGVDPKNAIMIGDTPYDVEGARKNGVVCIGVTWGHGADRLAASQPAAICERPADLPQIVRRLAV